MRWLKTEIRAIKNKGSNNNDYVNIEPKEGSVEDILAVFREVKKEVDPHVFLVDLIEGMEKLEKAEKTKKEKKLKRKFNKK